MREEEFGIVEQNLGIVEYVLRRVSPFAVAWIVLHALVELVIFQFRKSIDMFSDQLKRRSFANRTMTFLHSSVSIVWGTLILVRGPRWNLVNTAEQQRLLDVSLGYFFADLLYMLIFDPSIVFLLHHIGGITLELLIAASGVGGWYGILGLYLGEITNPIQTVWSGAKYYGYRWLYVALTPMFTYVFIFVRVFIVPATSTYCVYDSLRGYPNLMGMTWIVTFAGMMFAVDVAGFVWCVSLWRGYRKHHNRRTESVAPAPMS